MLWEEYKNIFIPIIIYFVVMLVVLSPILIIYLIKMREGKAVAWWEKEKKLCYMIFTLVALASVGVVAVIINDGMRWHNVLEETVWVQVIDKHELRKRRSSDDAGIREITFETSDGTQIRLEFRGDMRGIYLEIQAGDTGILTYKGSIDSEKVSDRLFISFEKD